MNHEIENFLSSHPYAEKTKIIYRPILQDLTALSDLHLLDPQRLINFISRPSWGNSQQNVALHCSKKFLRWKFGALHPALNARIKHITPPPRRSLDPSQALQILASFNTYTAAGARGLAIVAFALDTGFRRAELCSMQLSNVDFYNNTAQALCKGGQWGIGAFTPETAIILQQWLQFRKPADGVGNLFVSLQTGQGLTGEGIKCFFNRLSSVVGFKISAHDLRSSFATLATIYGANTRTLQLAGRWQSPEMVEHYTGNLQIEAIRPHLPMSNLLKT